MKLRLKDGGKVILELVQDTSKEPRVDHGGRIHGGARLDVHHRKATTIEFLSKCIRLGAGGARGRGMRNRSVVAARSTEMLEMFPMEHAVPSCEEKVGT